MTKCIVKDCPNEEYHADPIYHSKYCVEHLDFDENLKPFTDEEAIEFYESHDAEKRKILQALKLKRLIEQKMKWASPYKSMQGLNGYLYRELRQMIEESKK